MYVHVCLLLRYHWFQISDVKSILIFIICLLAFSYIFWSWLKKPNISNTLPQYSNFIIIVGKCYFRILIQPIMVSIWRNRVHFINLHSGNIVIIMAIFSTIEYIERNEKNHQFLKMSILEVFRRYLVSLFTLSGIGMRLFCLKEFLLNLQNRSRAFRNKVCVKVMKELMKGF